MKGVIVCGILLFAFFSLPHRILSQSKDVTPTSIPTSAIDFDRSSSYPECDTNKKIRVPNSILKYLKWTDTCVKPTMIVIHYTAEWSDTDDTIVVLNDRGLGCHLATRKSELVQLMDLYEDKVERAGCAAGYNNFAVHNEISGAYFDVVITEPGHEFYQELIESTDTAVQSTCWMMKQYDIPYTQIFGHHEITPGKPDPGPLYMEYFRNRIKEECV